MRSETLDKLAALVAAPSAASGRPVAGRPQAGVKDRTATLNRHETVRVERLTRQAARRLTQIGAQIKAIEAAARALVEDDPNLDLDLLSSDPRCDGRAGGASVDSIFGRKRL